MGEGKAMARMVGFVEGSTTERIYKFIVKNRAITSDEIKEEFKDVPRTAVSSYLKQLIKNKYVVKSKEKSQSLKRKCSGLFVFGIDEEAIQEKLYLLNKRVDKKELLEGNKKAIFDIMNKSDTGFTTSEVFYELRLATNRPDYNNWNYVYTCLRELINACLIKRSPFMMPDNCMVNGRKPGFIYGRDDKSIAKKMVGLMEREVRDAFLMITQSNEIYSVEMLEEKFKMTSEQIKSWFDYRLSTIGWIRIYSFKQRRYYYNPSVPLNLVEEIVPKLHKNQITQSILNVTSLGREFEHQALYYFVMYLITRYGVQIRLNEDFPKNIPSWFNPKDIEKYTVGGNKNFKITVDVWKFDSEPVDYLIFCYDEILKVPIQGYAVSIKRDRKSHMLGNAGKNYIASLIGCLSKGMTLNLEHIPCVNSLVPVIIMNNPNGIKLFEWARKCGCLLLYSKKVEEIAEYVNKFGFKYENDLELSKIKHFQELFEKYKDHKDVILGKVQIEDLIKLKRDYQDGA